MPQKNTERKQAEERMKRAAEEWRAAFDSITEMVSIHDRDFKIVRANKAFAYAFNMEPEQIIDRTCYELIHDTNEPPSHCPHMETMRTKEPSTREIFTPHLGIHMEITAAPIFDDKGDVVASVHVARDITERRNAEEELQKYSDNLERIVEQRTQELKEKTEKLLVSERLALVGGITSGIAHDLRNPLNVISNAAGLVEIILKDKEPDPKMDKSIELLKAGVEQAINVIDSLMGSVRKTEVDLEKIQISEYLYKIMGNLPVPENVQLIVENREAIVELPPIMADPKQLERVFQNLAKNAFEAMPDGGAITICPSINDSYLRVEIKDTGKGIPPENIVKVFEPLFTSKTGSDGTGIGLSVCRSIIEAHGGTIAVESEEGRGAKFTIQLPFLAS